MSCLRWAAQIDKSLGEKGPEQSMLLDETWTKTFHHNLYGIVQQLRLCTHLTLRRHVEAESTKAPGRVWKYRHFSRIAWTFSLSYFCQNRCVGGRNPIIICALPPKWTIFLWIQHKARCWSQRARLPENWGIREIMSCANTDVYPGFNCSSLPAGLGRNGECERKFEENFRKF